MNERISSTINMIKGYKTAKYTERHWKEDVNKESLETEHIGRIDNLTSPHTY